MNTASFNSVTIRASLESVDKGQIEAAKSVGMNSFHTLFRIIIPEALEVAIPSLGNSLIGLMKGTSLAFTCAVVEITAQAKIIAGRDYRYFEAYTAIAIIYWITTLVLEFILYLIEQKIHIPDVAGTEKKRRVFKNDKNTITE
jgi:polar amino acid transport system permease protein